MIRTRIAPSPTGADLHIGSVYTAYLNSVFARQSNGAFIVRIEDTDRTRLVPGAEEKFMQTLAEYGIIADESPEIGGPHAPYRQSERLALYKKYASDLVAHGHAYICTCTKERLESVRDQQKAAKQIPRYDGYCRDRGLTVESVGETPYVIRMRMPEDEVISVSDAIRGKIDINTRDLDDQVLLKTDGFPTYHLAVVVDDHLMEITHVIRAEEWINSTPKHILLYRYFGWELPVFCHVPLLRNPDKSKLSKRKNPVWASWFLEQGYLPDAMVNYLALMGWSHPQQKEIFTRNEFQHLFSLSDLKAVGPAFDIKKLEWMNGEYIRASTIAELQSLISHYLEKYQPAIFTQVEVKRSLFEQSVPLVHERMKKLSDYWSLCAFLFTRPSTHEIDITLQKEIYGKTRHQLSTLSSWSALSIGETMQQVCDEVGMKKSDYFMLMRVAISGKKVSPPLNESMELLGKEECLARLV